MEEKEIVMFNAMNIVNEQLKLNPDNKGLIKLLDSMYDFIEGFMNE